MLRRIAGVLLGLGMLGFAATPAGATTDFGGRTSGSFTGTTSYTFTTDGCSFVHQVYEGTFGPRTKPIGTFRLAGCVNLTSSFGYTGTFTVTTHGGGLTGTVAGTIEAATLPCAPFHFTLTVTGGSGRLHRTRGTIAVEGEWCNRGQVPAVHDPIDGHYVASLTR
jgi:hypothetical protein